MNFDAVVFGAIDNGVLVLGMLLGVEFGDWVLPHKWRSKAAGAAMGGFIGNTISDGLAGISISPTFALGCVIGCLTPVVVMPWVLKRANGHPR